MTNTECVCFQNKWCKKCYAKIYYQSNKEKIRQYQRDLYAKKRESENNSHFEIKRGEFIISFK